MRTYILSCLMILASIETFGQHNQDSLLANKQLGISIKLLEKGEQKEALQALFLLKTGVLRNGSLQQKALCQYYVAESYYGMDYKDSAIIFYDSAKMAFKISKDTLMQAQSAYYLSYEQLIQGFYAKSLKNIKEADLAYESIKDTAGMVKSLTWTSIIYHDTQQYDLGITYGNKAYQLSKLHNAPNADLTAKALNAIAINYDDKGDVNKAIEYHLKVIELKTSLSDTSKLAPTYNNIGNSLMKKGDYTEANKYFIKNLAFNKIDSSQYGLATVYTNLGTVAYLNKNWAEAKSYLTKAEKISYSIGDAEKIQDVLYQQFKFNNDAKNFPDAIRYLTDYHLLKDSLLSIEKFNALQALETIHKTKEKELEIEQQNLTISNQQLVLKKNTLLIIVLISLVVLLLIVGLLIKNRITRKQQLALQQKEIDYREAQLSSIISTQEKERARFSSDLHDSFGQTISILKMNITTAQKELNPTANSEIIFAESTKMLNAMYDELRTICANLMPATLQKAGLVQALIEFAQRINTAGIINVEINNVGNSLVFQELQEVALYRIVQEWVNNILKYGTAKNILIQITSDSEEVTVIVEDDGLGFDQSLLSQSKGNGWRNINSRIKLLNGTITLDTTPELKGSILIINIPVKQG